MTLRLANPNLSLPLLNQESDPTRTDLRNIQVWSKQIVTDAFKVTVGKQPAPTFTPMRFMGTFVGAAAAGVLNVPLGGLVQGYCATVCSGDVGAGCSQVAINLAGCTLSVLQVVCYTPAGVTITGNVRVNYEIIGV